MLTKNRPTSNDVHISGPVNISGSSSQVSKPWTAEAPPPPAVNWSQPEKELCTRVANGILSEGGTEREAIMACIGAVNQMREKNELNKANHAYGLCMLCKENPPDNDALWQDEEGGLHRAWMCAKCFPGWYAEKGQMVIHTHGIEGAASRRYRPIRHSPKEGKRKVGKDSRFRINGAEVTLAELAKAWLVAQPVEQAAVESSEPDVVAKAWLMEVIEKQEERQVVYGIALRVGVPDSQGDIIKSENEVFDAAHDFMIKSRRADWHHRETVSQDKAVAVESFVAMSNFEVNGVAIKKGDWIIGMKIFDKDMWQAVKKGEVNAFSIKGMGKRTPVKT